ncbi:MAG: BrnT family toxin [candidate division NC10 bacterium]|nr:BrnT family toxin [candidate division NC10 bacterium]
MTIRFEWNPKKAAQNVADHGVSFEEASSVFADPLARIFDDEDHSNDEQREIIIGHSIRDRLLIVSFTERYGAVRIISARKATRNERKDYEENVSL